MENRQICTVVYGFVDENVIRDLATSREGNLIEFMNMLNIHVSGPLRNTRSDGDGFTGNSIKDYSLLVR